MSKGSKLNIPHRILLVCIVIINLLMAAGLCLSARAGTIAPSECHLAVLLCMTFPIWLAANVVLFVADLVWWRRTAFVPGIAMLICITSINDYCPIRIGKPQIAPGQQTLSIMTYNVMQMQNQTVDPDRSYNEQMEYVINEHPDIVCIVEALELARTPSNKFTDDQYSRLCKLYPYIYISGQNFALLSKYPAEAIPLDSYIDSCGSNWVAAWRVKAMDRVVNIFGVHLRSLKYTKQEKAGFREITNIDSVEYLNRQDLKFLRADILPKVINASLIRERQVERLATLVNRYGGENCLVVGDFNDPVGSYPLYLLKKDCHLQQSYSAAGSGPMITYNANHFYFRIDHILYRGALTPRKVWRGDIMASDHYPVNAIFTFKDK